ncbi:TonB-dependent receptor [Sphingosinicella humi]|uniref:TonB-dependent receptor n=1 Tax=Allosphingosinicella humi TaxID=2068657 RepID=A0A2U2J588_9SPHN|nr:TonB-dependent receptor [Sphingosinicella humi]PWG03498.1 TonB-dependent receptor [Sphingosinicella humi]
MQVAKVDLFCCGSLAALCLASLQATPAHAQDASTSSAGPTASIEQPEKVGEIIVTARKRAERLIEVPEAITAFTSQQIEESGIESVNDVALRVPNFSIVEAQQPGVSAINIRGIGQVRNAEPPVAVIVDGVQLSSASQITQDLFDIERIEVIKGPQGATYGRNALGGAINIVTRRPTNDFEGWGQVGYETGDTFAASAAVSGPIVEDRLLFRISGSLRNSDGDIPNVTLERPANFEDSQNFRASLLAQLSERMELDLRYSRLDTEAGAAWYTLVPPGTSINAVLPVTADRLGRSERVLDDASAKLDVDLGAATLTSITAYSKVSSDLDEDFDFTPLDLLSATQTVREESWSQELRLASARSGPLKWLAGAYYLETDKSLDSVVFLRPGAGGLLVPFPIPGPVPFSATRSTDDNQAYALFGQIGYRILHKVEATVAARQDWDERVQLDRVAGEAFARTFKSFQPKFQLTYYPNDDATFYVSVGKGFRSGGFNPNDRIVRSFDKEEVWNYELGAKAALFDRRLSLSAAAFVTDIEDRQVYVFDLLAAAQIITNPIPAAQVRGLEVDAILRPLRGLELSASLGLLDSEIQRYDPTVFAGLPAAGDFTGNKLPQTAHSSYSLAAQYSHDIAADASVSARAEFNSSGGDYFWEIDNLDRRERIDLLNLRLTGRWRGLRVTAYVENLLDEEYVLEYISQRFSGAPLGNYSIPAPDRRWGFQLRHQF